MSETALRLRAACAHRARLVGRGRAHRPRALYPLIVDSLQELPLLGDFVPSTGSMVVMLAFTMMALGLNVVVGYAGLLDLGYVAFYAAGAYVAGWFASLHFEDITFHLGSARRRRPSRHPPLDVAGPRSSAGFFTAAVGIVIGLPTLRLRGDYLAIVTLGFGEIVPQFVRNADSVGRLQPDERNLRNQPDRLACDRRRSSFARSRTRTTSTSGRRSASSSSPCSAASGFATRDSAGRGSRSARTRRRPPRWAFR